MGTIHEPITYPLSHHSSNPLQVPSDDSLNASYIAQLRPLLDAEKARAAKGLPPKTSSTPSAHAPVSDEAGVMDGVGDSTFRPSDHVLADEPEQRDGATLQGLGDAEDDDGVHVQLEGPEAGHDVFDDSQFDTTLLPGHTADDDTVGHYEENTIMLRDPEDRAQVEAEMRDLESAVPRILRDYHLLDRLGEGTFSTVYKALDITQDEQPIRKWHPSIAPLSAKSLVAVKRIYVTSSPQRIANELSILEECRNCRNVSRLLTAFRYRDQVVAVMPYVPNQDFRDIFMTMPIRSIQAYFRCMFRALADIHALGIVHRDVKPANFLFNPIQNTGVLCDFGLAQRLANEVPTNACFHTPGSKSHPHGKHRVLKEHQRARVAEKIQEARKRSAVASDRVGVPSEETRPSLKANRAGTRGFRAPEVLFKCPDQTVALDIWSAGTILMCILACKFPIFTASDDVEALMEFAAVCGRRTMEKCGKLHCRTFATNIPSVDHEEMSWRELVARINPHLYQLDPSTSSSFRNTTTTLPKTARGAVAPHPRPRPQSQLQSRKLTANTLPPLTQTSSLPSLASLSQQHQPQPQAGSQVDIPPTKHNRLIDFALDLMSQCLHWDPTRRITSAEALQHPFLFEDLPCSVDADGDCELGGWEEYDRGHGGG